MRPRRRRHRPFSSHSSPTNALRYGAFSVLNTHSGTTRLTPPFSAPFFLLPISFALRVAPSPKDEDKSSCLPGRASIISKTAGTQVKILGSIRFHQLQHHPLFVLPIWTLGTSPQPISVCKGTRRECGGPRSAVLAPLLRQGSLQRAEGQSLPLANV